MSLEEYAFFLEDPFNDDVLTTAQLHQIILMHGFRRIHKRSKLGEAKRDSESLKWQKCSDQSIETVLCNHKTNYAVKSNGHGDALKSFVW